MVKHNNQKWVISELEKELRRIKREKISLEKENDSLKRDLRMREIFHKEKIDELNLLIKEKSVE